ncbi:hypothetical protein SAMN02799630_00906 [Paenibacillus sp. UNCCL117]|uniref:hypothetical protein n=1 Tax=unclassified Paenibacillus TaxID=185978 RepID=UPI00087E9A05|nr:MULTISPECIES: hypothetical protein [unclassified Paenibacillus]SDC24831.1 hypothetical protein SAMN04488602_101707 [Paenibacillus sp. cl123]SFW19679.1 hypothetical protein SAMN02799630_00906 [Paenibacillus sp. UNCCL117]
MMTLLAVIGALVGLLVTGSAIFMAVTAASRPRTDDAPAEAVAEDMAEEAKPRTADRWRNAAPQLMQWTFFDYALLVLFLIGSLFLFTDLIAALRDEASFPPYHVPYLLCGFIFTCAAALMMLARLSVVLAVARSERVRSPEYQEHKPGHAQHAE